jgi:hypothetical protein
MQAINKKRWVWIVLISAFTAGFLPAQTDADEKPVRLYINISESEKVTFPQAADEVTASVRGVVRVVQPTPNVLLLEAMSLGKTTVTVSTGGQIKRFFVTTFENRGADVLNIQNSFTAKGYNLLQVGFDTSLRDQIILSGIVGTQEELDDAVAIVKKYTPFVVVRATVGQMEVRDGFSEHETVIVNNIIRISRAIVFRTSRKPTAMLRGAPRRAALNFQAKRLRRPVAKPGARGLRKWRLCKIRKRR